MIDVLVEVAIAALAAILAITLHEAAHGYAAWALGDDTARQEGRLSLNPLAHVDRMGTIVLPGFLLVAQLLTIHRVAFMFGWAKPVPVASWRFRDPRRGMMFVAAAGPAMNFFLAWVAALLMPRVAMFGMRGFNMDQFLDLISSRFGFAGQFLVSFMLFNLVLGLFNLLPIPPLDGGRIAVGLLPKSMAESWARLERAGIVIVVLLVFLLPRLLAEFGLRFDPVGHALGTVIPWAAGLILRLAGHPIDGLNDFSI